MQVHEHHFSGAIHGGGPEPVVVVLSGELDADYQAEADSLLSRAAASTRGDVWVDVSDLSFIGACGVGVLAALADRVGQHGGSVVLVGAEPLLVKLLDLAGVSGWFSLRSLDDLPR